jgi:enediyne biosynthesis protein E4
MTAPPNTENESFINTAFRLVLAFFVILCVAVTMGWIHWRSERHQGDRLSIVANRTASPWSPNDLPDTPFTDITVESGLRFVRNNGGTGNKYLPETMGGGAAFLDYDNDGDQDLLLVNGTELGKTLNTSNIDSTLTLLENDGSGRFTDVRGSGGLSQTQHGMGVAAADYNGDGWIDVFVSNVGGNRLFKNNQGYFEDVTQDAQIRGSSSAWSTSCTWFDFDRDGWLDLFVGNYVNWSPEIDREIHYTLPTIGKAYGPPMQFEGACSYLYHNKGNGTFEDVSSQSGIEVRHPITRAPIGKALGVCSVDLNQDGWMDLVVANDTVQNFVFLNQQNGRFEEIGERSGIAFDSYGGTRGAMGIDAGRFQDHQTLGISIGNFANEMTALYVAKNQSLLFTDEAIHQGIGSSSLLPLTFGVFFFDYDLDGWLDLLTVNGHIEPEINRIANQQAYRQSLQLFWNLSGVGGNGFAPVSKAKVGTAFLQPVVGRGSAYADIDGDGDLDVVVVQNEGPARLFRNDQDLGHQWIRLYLKAPSPNTSAIGSSVEVKLRGRTIVRRVSPYRGYLSQSELPVTIGLGDADQILSVKIDWHDGSQNTLTDVPLNRAITVFKADLPVSR